jgi:hypothetical protein
MSQPQQRPIVGVAAAIAATAIDSREADRNAVEETQRRLQLSQLRATAYYAEDLERDRDDDEHSITDSVYHHILS